MLSLNASFYHILYGNIIKNINKYSLNCNRTIYKCWVLVTELISIIEDLLASDFFYLYIIYNFQNVIFNSLYITSPFTTFWKFCIYCNDLQGKIIQVQNALHYNNKLCITITDSAHYFKIANTYTCVQ